MRGTSRTEYALWFLVNAGADGVFAADHYVGHNAQRSKDMTSDRLQLAIHRKL